MINRIDGSLAVRYKEVAQEMGKLIMAASSVSSLEMKSNKKYFSVSMRMFSTRPNLNNEAVTEAFIDNIVKNKQDYICMPLCVDVSTLKDGKWDKLTHLYDGNTNTFRADEIGSFYDFEKVEDEYGVSLIGYARINKRSPVVTEMIQQMFRDGKLYVSFEIEAGKVQEVDGVTLVDADPENELTAMTIVSVPAYPESEALAMVAEKTASTSAETLEAESADGSNGLNLTQVIFNDSHVMLCDSDIGNSDKRKPVPDSDNAGVKDEAEGSEKEMDENKMTEVKPEEQIKAEDEMLEKEPEQKEETPDVQPDAEPEAEIKTEDEADAEDKPEEAPAPEPEPEPESDDEESMSALKKRCSELETQIAELEQFRSELEDLKAKKAAEELQQKKDALKNFAEGEGLPMDEPEVCDALDKLNYEVILLKLMERKAKAPEPKPAENLSPEDKNDDKDSKPYYASYVEMRQGGFDYLFKNC